MNITPYGQAYATYYPLYTAGYRRYDAEYCRRAKADILATLPLHDACSAYVGKLMAELDACRDREMFLNRKGAK